MKSTELLCERNQTYREMVIDQFQKAHTDQDIVRALDTAIKGYGGKDHRIYLYETETACIQYAGPNWYYAAYQRYDQIVEAWKGSRDQGPYPTFLLDVTQLYDEIVIAYEEELDEYKVDPEDLLDEIIKQADSLYYHSVYIRDLIEDMAKEKSEAA